MAAKGNKAAGKTSFLIRVLVFINYLIVIPLLLSYLAAYVSPAKSWVIALFGLFFPVFALINLFFLLAWAFFLKRYLLISAIALLIGIPNMVNQMQANTSTAPELLQNKIKVLTLNVKSFDLYNYNKDWTINYTGRNKLFKYLKKDSSDIACFQEFVHIKDIFPTYDTMSLFMKANQPHVHFVRSNQDNNFGIATFTAYPIVHRGHVPFKSESTNACIFTDIKIKEDTLRVYNIHFESIHLSRRDYEFASELATNPNHLNEEQIKTNSIKLLKMLKKAYTVRARQVEMVDHHIQSSPYPVVVCGDFNDPPDSYSYHTIAKTLQDAFTESGKGLGNTYIGRFPFNILRIDYIFHSREIKSYNLETVPVILSDHHPVTCYIELNK